MENENRVAPESDISQQRADDTATTSQPKAAKPKSSKSPAKKAVAPKKAAAKKAAAKSTVKKPPRPYPNITLERCLILAQKIKEKNGGNPWNSKEVFKAAGIGDTTQKWYYSASSRDFGLTNGTSHSTEIELTALGNEVVYAPSPEAELQKKREAFFRVPIFKGVVEHYKGGILPEMQYLGNTLFTTFGLDPIYHEEFAKVFSENCKYLKIGDDGAATLAISNGVPANAGNATILVGEAKSTAKGKHKAFVIMPFVERNDERADGFFKEVLDSLITPAGVAAGFNVETARRQGSDVIQSTIINALIDADLVIADLTDHNPNVLFELGLRIALDKPVALIKTKDTGRIFDVDNMLRIYEYSENLWKSTVATDLEQLTEHFKSAWDNKENSVTYMKLLRRGADVAQGATQ